MDQIRLSRKIDRLLLSGTPYYQPWLGTAYKEGGLLVMSESAYYWKDGHPRPSHPTKHTVEHSAFQNFANRKFRFATALTRALCKEEWPTLETIRKAWNQIAYSIYVQRPLPATNSRPTEKDFIDSGRSFLKLLNLYKPSRVVITGYEAWEQMPHTQVVIHDYKQAYRLENGALAWCLAVPHVQSRKLGHRFKWQEIGSRIQDFQAERLPKN